MNSMACPSLRACSSCLQVGVAPRMRSPRASERVRGAAPHTAFLSRDALNPYRGTRGHAEPPRPRPRPRTVAVRGLARGDRRATRPCPHRRRPPSPHSQVARPAPATRPGRPVLAPPPHARWRQALGVDADTAQAPPAANSNGAAAQKAPAAPAPSNGNGKGAAPAATHSNGNGNGNGAAQAPPAGLVDSGLVNSQFAAVLSAALSRSGGGALTSGSSIEDERES
jgi:hypothetical protein